MNSGNKCDKILKLRVRKLFNSFYTFYFGGSMDNREIDKNISKLVREKKLLNLSLKRTNNPEEIKGIKKRIIEINGLINIEKSKYDVKVNN